MSFKNNCFMTVSNKILRCDRVRKNLIFYKQGTISIVDLYIFENTHDRKSDMNVHRRPKRAEHEKFRKRKNRMSRKNF